MSETRDPTITHQKIILIKVSKILQLILQIG
jgi:hypothetical protein